MQIKINKPFGVIIQADDSHRHVSHVPVSTLRALFDVHQLIVLRGFQTFNDKNAFADYCEQFGQVSVWPFGKVLELVEQEQPKDHIFDNSYMPMHWDGMYRLQVPEYQIFHCLRAPLSGQGGRTTFSNTKMVLESVSPEMKETWSNVTGIYQREMAFYKSKTVSPIICQHPKKGYHVIRYNEPPRAEQGEFVNPPDLAFKGLGVEELSAFHQSLNDALYAPENYYAHEWQANDIVIADNFTLLHGRESFVSKTPRHIQRVHVESDPPFDNPALESYQ